MQFTYRQDRYQVRTSQYIPFDTGNMYAVHKVQDMVTSQYVAEHDTKEGAQREADLRNTDYCHALATQYAVENIVPGFDGRYVVVDRMRADGEERTGPLSKRMMPQALAEELAAFANRTQPAWDATLDEVLDAMRTERIKLKISREHWYDALDAAGMSEGEYDYQIVGGTWTLTINSFSPQRLFVFVAHLTTVTAKDAAPISDDWANLHAFMLEDMRFHKRPGQPYILTFPGTCLG